MEIRHYFCDVCKKEVAESKDLRTISIGNGGDYTSYSAYNRFEVYKKYDLCIDCRNQLGIVLPNNYVKTDVESVEQRLFNVVAEIVAMNQPNN